MHSVYIIKEWSLFLYLRITTCGFFYSQTGSWVNAASQATHRPWGDRNSQFHRVDQRKNPDQRNFSQVHYIPLDAYWASVYTNTESDRNVLTTCCISSDSPSRILSLLVRIFTVGIQGVHSQTLTLTKENEGYSQEWSLVLSSPQSPSTLRSEKVTWNPLYSTLNAAPLLRDVQHVITL